MIEALQERFRNDRTQQPVFYDAGDFEGNRWSGGNLPDFKFLAFLEAVARDAGYAVKDLRNWAEEAARSEKLGKRAIREEIQAWFEHKVQKPGELGATIDDSLEDWLRMMALAVRLGLLKELQEFIGTVDFYAIPLTQKMKVARDLNELEALLEPSN